MGFSIVKQLVFEGRKRSYVIAVRWEGDLFPVAKATHGLALIANKTQELILRGLVVPLVADGKSRSAKELREPVAMQQRPPLAYARGLRCSRSKAARGLRSSRCCCRQGVSLEVLDALLVLFCRELEKYSLVNFLCNLYKEIREKFIRQYR